MREASRQPHSAEQYRRADKKCHDYEGVKRQNHAKMLRHGTPLRPRLPWAVSCHGSGLTEKTAPLTECRALFATATFQGIAPPLPAEKWRASAHVRKGTIVLLSLR